MSHNHQSLILMSTYNGEKYLAAQLDSLIAQTHTNWTLLIRDDGSADKTIDIIKQYTLQDARIELVSDNLGNLNVVKSFAALMNKALERNEPTIFFCDQDDVWLPHKMQATLQLLQQIEKENTQGIPVLIHTDLHVVDSNLKTIQPSFMQFEGLKRNPNAPLRTLLINNYITGCTIGMNRALLTLASPMPDEARMHDWWCGLCAAACGKIGFLETPAILYRQHDRNAVGSKGFYGKIRELRSFKKAVRHRLQSIAACFRQAKSLLVRISGNNEHYHFIKQFTCILDKRKPFRCLSTLRSGIQPTNIVRGLVFLLLVGFV